MQYLSELRLFAFPFAPKGWAVCDGSLLLIIKNEALFALLGTNYGGDGRTTFALPNLMGRVPVHVNNQFALGTIGGEAEHVLTMNEIPAHTHNAVASTQSPNVNSPANAVWGSNTGVTPYGSPTDGLAAMDPRALLPAGSNLGHDNMSPYVTVLICIAIVGVFPTRNLVNP